MSFRCLFFFFSVVLALAANVTAQEVPPARRTSVAVLDFGDHSLGRRAADKLSAALSSSRELAMIDREESRAAARGAGYWGSLNMTLAEARDLGSSVGCDFYVTGDAQTLRRSPSAGPVFHEAYASIFFVSTRTGRLVTWERPSFVASSPEEAEMLLLSTVGGRDIRHRHLTALRRAQEDERDERALAVARGIPVVIAAAPEDDADETQNLRLPQPYRRLQPGYPETAARAEAEATVDVLVDLSAEGEVGRVEVVRWAGFGLDEATVNVVRRLHFRPATRDGVKVPMRVLLRYNFRRPQK